MRTSGWTDIGDNEMGRLKDRSESFKMRGKKIDFAAESHAMSKSAREEYVEKVRKLEKVKEYLSPGKDSSEIGRT
eukprot:8489375-Karenia_brevis.AAC.1